MVCRSRERYDCENGPTPLGIVIVPASAHGAEPTVTCCSENVSQVWRRPELSQVSGNLRCGRHDAESDDEMLRVKIEQRVHRGTREFQVAFTTLVSDGFVFNASTD